MKQPAPRLTHLYLENWRNFTRVEASLDRRVLLVGPNASGKSNLLDALPLARVVRQVHFVIAMTGNSHQSGRKAGRPQHRHGQDLRRLGPA